MPEKGEVVVLGCPGLRSEGGDSRAGPDDASSWIDDEAFEKALRDCPKVSLFCSSFFFAGLHEGVNFSGRAAWISVWGGGVYKQRIPFGGAPRTGTLSVALPASIAANAQVGEAAALAEKVALEERFVLPQRASLLCPALLPFAVR